MVSAVDPYLFPARGRKLSARFKTPSYPSGVDPYLFPARGRKLIRAVIQGRVGDSTVDPYLFPARGRKHLLGFDFPR